MGELLFKFLMEKSAVYTRATSPHLKENLTNLETHITTINSNIRTSNQRVKINVKGLKAGSEKTYNLVANLFKAYHKSLYTVLFCYIKTKKYCYNDGEDITPEKLMTEALDNYEVLLTSGKWNTMFPEK